MRKIKFRGKRLDNEEWVYGTLYQSGFQEIQDKKGHFIKEERYYQIYNDKAVPQFINIETVGQFTGLYDKNGKEVYEGDIIKFRFKTDRQEFPDLVGYIEYQTTFGAFVIMSNQGGFKIDIIEIKFIEVIGNIYDNKDLLEGE